MTKKEELTEAMTRLGKEHDVRFIGYNLCKYGGSAGSTLSNVSEEQIFELPLAENLMAGAAIGLSLSGFVPVLWFERMDFMTCAMDAIVNHLNQIANLSDKMHCPAVIIRACVGNKAKPLHTGPTHTQDFTEAMKRLVSFPVINTWWAAEGAILREYELALERARAGTSTLIVEYKDQWG